MNMASKSNNFGKETQQLESEESPKKSFPLHKVVEYKIIHKIKILLPETKDINEKDEDGNTVLHLACEHTNNEEILELLLSREDIDASIMNNKGLTALHSLAFKGNLSGIIKLLKKFPNLNINVETEGKETSLIMATLMNHTDVILYLLAEGADVDHGNHKKWTALHYAANNGYTACAQMLIDHGADVNFRDAYLQTPLMKSSKWGFLETSEVLLTSGALVDLACDLDFTALYHSCINNSVEVTKLLISHGANVNLPGPHSISLFKCAQRGSLECAKELLKAGVNVTARKGRYTTALSIAEQWGQKDMVKLLRPYFS